MNVLNFNEGQLYSFIDEKARDDFLAQGMAQGDETLAEFIGLEPFSVVMNFSEDVFSVKNNEGEVLTQEDLDQSFLLGSGDAPFFKTEKTDPEVIYAKIKAYISSLAGEDFLEALHTKDALNPIYQTCYEFFPNNDAED